MNNKLVGGMIVFLIIVSGALGFIEENKVTAGKPLLIDLTGMNAKTIKIEGPNYNLLEETDIIYSFTPPKEGTYKIKVYDNTGEIVENETIEASNPIFTKTTTDKKEYTLGDTVEIVLNEDAIPEERKPLSITITGPEKSYNLIREKGDSTEIKFTPRAIGNYILKTKDKEGTLIEELNFNVKFPELEELKIEEQPVITKRRQIEVKDSSNRYLLADIKVKAEDGISKTLETNQPLSEGTYEVDVDLGNKPVERIKLKGVTATETIDLPVDDLETKEYKINSMVSKKAYALDLSKVNFTNGTLTATAKGNQLWKCKEWDFSTRTCNGEWKQIGKITPGKEYSVMLSPEDPGFVETLTVIDVQSYPVVGGNWTVRFNTTGTADLRITPVKGTNWNDLELLNVKCGGTEQNYQWEGNTVLIENYTCNGISTETSKVKTIGKHHLKFEFGGQIGYANNYASASGILRLRDQGGGIDVNLAYPNGATITWDTEDREDADYTHSADSDTVTVNADGVYRISYGVALDRATTNTRVEHYAQLLINENERAECWSQTYTRGSDQVQNGQLTSDCLVELNDGDNISIEAGRTSSSSLATTTTADRSWLHVQRLLKTNVLMLRDEGGGQDMNQLSGTVLDWDTVDRQDSAYNFSATDSVVTIDEDGLYRITLGLGVDQNSVRYGGLGIILQNGNPLPAAAHTYIRDSTNSEDGVVTVDILANASRGDTFIVEGYRASEVSSATADTEENETWWQFEKIPDSDANVIIVHDSAGGTDLDNTGGINIPWDTTDRIDDDFQKTDTDTITVQRTGLYRISYGVYSNRTSGDGNRVELTTYLRVNNIDQEECIASGYNRGDQGNQYVLEASNTASCMVLLNQSDTVEIRSYRTSQDSVTIWAHADRSWLNIQSLDVINTDPSITLNSPANLSNHTTTSITFNFTAFDDENMTCTLWANFSGVWAANESVSDVRTGISQAITVPVEDGSYRWNVNCTDIWEAAGTAESDYNFAKDSTPPVVTNARVNVTTINQSHTVRFNVTITDGLALKWTNATLRKPDATTELLILTFLGDDTYTYIITETNETGTYNITHVRATDSFGNTVVSVQSGVGFSVTESRPDPFNLLTPANETESNNLLPNLTWEQSADEHFLNYTILLDQDPAFGSVDYTYYTTAVDVTDFLVPFSLDANTVYYWRVIAQDIFFNQRRSNSDFNYITDTLFPTITLNSPENNTFVSSNPAEFNYTVTETNTLETCRLYGNFSGSWIVEDTDNNPNNGVSNILTTTLTDGTYVWNVECNDSAGNRGFASANITIIADYTGPENITLVSPENNSIENETNNLAFTIISTDIASNTSSCSLILNNVVEATNNSVEEGIPFNLTDFVQNGQYFWNVSCTDINGNTASSVIYNLTVEVVDRDPPFITQNLPPELEYIRNTSVHINYTVEDATGIENCSVILNNTLNTTDELVENFVSNNFEIEDLSEGVYTWEIKCFDNSTEFNNATSSTRTFTIDVTQPSTFNLLTVNNNSIVKVSYTTLVFEQVTELNFLNYTIIIDTNPLFTSPDYRYVTTDITNTSIPTGNLPDNTYYWKVTAHDLAGNERNSSEYFQFRIKEGPPILQDPTENPEDPIEYNETRVYRFNVTIIEPSLSTIIFESNVTGTLINSSPTGIETTDNETYFVYYETTGITPGLYFYKWHANDTINQRNATISYSYIVTKELSQINLVINGTDGNFGVNEDSPVNLSAAMILPDNGIVQLFRNGTYIGNGSSRYDQEVTFTEPGLYNITAIFPENSNYTTGRDWHLIFVNDTTEPEVTITSPENNSFVGTLDATIAYIVQDSSTINNCSIYIDGIFNDSDDSVARNTTQSFSVTFTEGRYNAIIQCYDGANNLGSYGHVNFTIQETEAVFVDVNSTQPQFEVGQTANITIETLDEFDNILVANVTLDIIKGNTSLSWWNTNWEYRKPVKLTNPNTFESERTVIINVSGLGSNITNCDEIRIVKNESQEHTLIPHRELLGDDNNWCLVEFNAELEANITNGTNYYAYYGNNGAGAPGSYSPAQFRVQRGSLVSTGTTITGLVDSVNISRSLLLFTYIAGDTSPDGGMFTEELTTSQIQFSRYTSASSTIAWQIIEHPDFYVQRGSGTLGANEASANITINAIDLESSFIIVYGRADDTGGGEHHDGWTTARFTDNETVNIQRGNTDEDSTYSYQVVQWKGARVQSGNATITGASVFSVGTSIETLDIDRSFMVFGRRTPATSTGINDQHAFGNISSSSSIYFQRNDDNGRMDIEYFVVEMPEGNSIQRYSPFIDGSVDNDIDVTLQSLNTSASFSYISWDNTGDGTTFTNSYLVGNITTSTNIRLFKQTTGQDPDVSVYIQELNPGNIISVLEDEADEFIRRSEGPTNALGQYHLSYDTINETLGNYTALAVGAASGFRDGVGIHGFTVIPDQTPPNITLVLPEDDSQAGVGTVNFTYYVEDINLANCTLYFGTVNLTANTSFTHVPANDSQNNTFVDVFLTVGSYQWNVNCSDELGNWGFAEYNFTFNITEPDPTIQSENITFSVETGVEGDAITIYANITNEGLTAANTTFTVQFYIDDPDSGGEQINGNQTIDFIEAGGNAWVSVDYNLRIGPNNIFVLIDPYNEINESNEDNNKENNTIVVSLYQFFYGNVTKAIVLDDGGNNTFVEISTNLSTTNAHVFVADKDSAFSFADLQSLGRTLSGLPTANDFSDADTNLNMTDYNDTINNVWTDNTNTPRDLVNVSLTIGTIYNVPVLYTTNNSLFYSGILWDTVDDQSLNEQFDTTDDEDLVWVTTVNRSTIGTYGTYDYELKVPALLREYKGSQDQLEVYVELA